MKPGKADRTKQHIIEKAAPFFNKKGYADTSLSDITAATGLTKGAIYGNFENKDELAIRVFEYNLSFLQQGIADAIADKNDAIARLLAMTDFYRKEYRSVAQKGGCPLMNAAVEADDNFPALKLRVRAAIRSWKKKITGIIEEGKTKNQILKGADADRFAAVFLSLIEGGIMLSKATDDSSYLFSALEQADELIISGLKV